MPRLSTARATVLDHLADQPLPCRVTSVARLLGQHHNTVREHLDGLVRVGLATREAAEPEGRGRPAWLYSAVYRGREHLSRPESREYVDIASAFVANMGSTSRPVVDAEDAGASWGRELIASGPRDSTPQNRRPGGPLPAAAARRAVVRLLDDLGFAPEADDDAKDVRLRHCPLLEVAHQQTELVCGVHLGLVRGALAELGADPTRTSLEPFSEPGECRLQLLTVRKR